MKRLLPLSLLLLPLSLAGQEVNLKGPELWSVKFTEFESLLSDESQITKIIPQQMAKKMSNIKERELSIEEREFYQKSAIVAEWRKKVATLNQTVAEREALLFKSNLSSSEKDQQLEKFNTTIDETKKSILFLERLPWHTVEVEETLPVKIEGGDSLLPPPERKDIVLKLENSIDFLIYGAVEVVNENLFVTIKGSGLFDSSEVIWKGVGREEKIEDIIDQATLFFTSYLLGREWGGIFVEVAPEDSEVIFNGEQVGFGDINLPFMEPQVLSVEVRRPGYLPHIEEVTLKESEIVKVEINLESIPKGTFVINTNPQGANVYLNSLWMGVSPLTIDTPAEKTALFLRMDGFLNQRVTIDPLAKESEILVTLIDEKVDLQQQFDKQKSRFYLSLGLFTISVGAPIIFNGIRNNYYLQYQTASTQEQVLSTYYYYDVFTKWYWASFGLSTVLAGNMLYHLYRYIKAGEALAQ